MYTNIILLFITRAFNILFNVPIFRTLMILILSIFDNVVSCIIVSINNNTNCINYEHFLLK